MVKRRTQPKHVETAAYLEEQRINRLKDVVDFATDRRLPLSHFDGVVHLVVRSPDENLGTPSPNEVEQFRDRFHEILIDIADGRTANFPSAHLAQLYVSADRVGLRYSSIDPATVVDPNDPPPGQDGLGMARRWRCVQNVLDQQTKRIRICKWEKCRKVFVRRSGSDYCDMKHAAAAARWRRKLKREAAMKATEGATNE